MRPIRTIAALAVMGLSACTVGPNYHPPAAALPASFAGPQAAPPPGQSIDPATWWQAFGDATLSDLVQRALADNPSIAEAASRVRQARLEEIQARAQYKPTLDASGSVNRIQLSKNAGFSQIARAFGGGGSGGAAGGGSSSGIGLPGSGITTYSLGFDASWELDLFGGGRRGVEAARARTEGAIWSGRDAAVTLAAEVADAYVSLRLDQEQIAVIGQELQRQQRALQIAGEQARAGLTPSIDTIRQRGAITATQARLEPLRADVDVRIHALGTLIGQPPATLLATLRTPTTLGETPVVPAGLPSDLLRRRPDIRAAERQLAAATADIGVAVADLYPKFSLTGGSLSLISTTLRTLFQGDSVQASGTAGGMFPILDWGRRKAAVGINKEQREQAYLEYRRTVLQALRDVEDPLSQIDAERRRGATLREALADQDRSLRAITAQYQAGLIAQDSVLNAENNVLTAREQIAASDAQIRQETVALFKAIGGGWSENAVMPPASFRDEK